GTCGSACSSVNGTASCVSGSCRIACNGGFADCDNDLATGCESALATDAANCGACGTPCMVAHATPACAGGGCRVGQCDVGWGDCNADPTDGCETDLGVTLAACGACGPAC